MDERMALPQGTLDLLILKALALEPLYGCAVSERLQQMRADALQVGQGSLYSALHRLERAGCVKARWRTTSRVSASGGSGRYAQLRRTRPEFPRGIGVRGSSLSRSCCSLPRMETGC